MTSTPNAFSTEINLCAQQDLMERVISPLHPDDRRVFQDPAGKYLPLNEWRRVKLNSNGDVISAKWGALFKMGGSLALEYLPPTIVEFSASSCCLTSVGDLSKVPPSLKYLGIGRNSFSEPLFEKKLPDGLVHIHAQSSSLKGRLRTENLPSTLLQLVVGFNELSGSVDMTKLPKNLRELWIHRNNLSGSINLSNLPRSMKTLILGHNRFSGSVDLRSLPPKLKDLNLQKNCFIGEVDLTNLPDSLSRLALNHNKFTGPVEVRRLAGMHMLLLNNNALSGRVRISDLTQHIAEIHFQENKIDEVAIEGPMPSTLRKILIDFPDGMTVHRGDMVTLQSRKRWVNLIGRRPGTIRRRFLRRGE